MIAHVVTSDLDRGHGYRSAYSRPVATLTHKMGLPRRTGAPRVGPALPHPRGGTAGVAPPQPRLRRSARHQASAKHFAHEMFDGMSNRTCKLDVACLFQSQIKLSKIAPLNTMCTNVGREEVTSMSKCMLTQFDSIL